MTTSSEEERDALPLRILDRAVAGSLICGALGIVLVGLALGVVTAQALLVRDAHTLPSVFLLIIGLVLFMAGPGVAVREGVLLRRQERAIRPERLGDSVVRVLMVGLVATAAGLLAIAWTVAPF